MDEVSILALKNLESLSDIDYNKKLAVAANLLGYEKIPVDVDTFIEDPYYLGNTFGKNMFPYWRKKLRELFPTPIHISDMIVVLTGAIGTGKSTFVRACSLYLQYRIYCLKDPYATLGLIPGKDINFIYFHVTGSKAISDFVSPNNEVKKLSPFFESSMGSKGLKLADVVDGAKTNNSIGGDTIFEVLSELNFVRVDIAEYKLDQAIKRIQSRFLGLVGYFILIIIDSSSRGDSSVTDKFLKSNPFSNQVKVIRAAIWDTRAHLNIYGRTGWFDVYAGDSLHKPFIITKDEPVTDEMDSTRIIKCPMELYSSFAFNIISSLQDQAGVSTKSTGKLFSDPDYVKSRFILPMYTDDVITVNFFNREDKLIDRLSQYLRDIPTEKVIYLRFDIGIKHDNTGIAITYLDRYTTFGDNVSVKLPVYRTPLAVALGRIPGQETSIFHLYEFVIDLSHQYEIGEVTADQFGSAQLLQDLTRANIPNKQLSVDRTDTPYIYFKNMVLNKLWTGCENKLAIKECSELCHVEGKVDHPSDGSKDIMDAISGSVYSCYKNLDNAEKMSIKFRYNQQSEWYKSREEELSNNILSSIYGIV